jgi:hypothetical protein
MWIPKDEAEIWQALADGSLTETATFDAKRELSTNKEIAKDIAAMANDGGVIIYGIGEDDNKQLTVSNPIPLKDVPEKINSIVRTNISEPPSIKVNCIPTKNDSAIGYVVVIVPASSRAPHMVIVKADNRYYGRNSAGNMILTEGEVSRLYERRRKFEEDAGVFLDEVISISPFSARPEIGCLYLTAKPLIHNDNLLEKAAQNAGGTQEDLLRRIRATAGDPALYPYGFSPDVISDIISVSWTRSAGGYRLDIPIDAKKPKEYSDITVKFDGSVICVCGNAAHRKDSRLFIYDKLIFGLTKRFIKFVTELYNAAQYAGAVELGIAVTGIHGGISLLEKYKVDTNPMEYDRTEYRKATRVDAITMQENLQNILATLVQSFIRDITRDEHKEFKIDKG